MTGGSALDRVLSPERRRRLRRPALLGTLRRLTPLSERWGSDRGGPVDRYYIERFLERHAGDIRGRVLEIKDDGYTRRFGRGVERSDVLDVDPANPRATIVADLAAADAVASESFDCIVCTQTLQYVFELEAAIGHLHRLLSPDGVLLVTVPAVSRVVDEAGLRDYWRLTEASAARLFGAAFGPAGVTVTAHGNVLASIAFLTGMAQEELRPRELDAADPRFPVIVAVRAVKDGQTGRAT